MDEFDRELVEMLSQRPRFQLESLEELMDYLDIKGHKMKSWDFCGNGCCIKIRCEGFDETVWGVTMLGYIYTNDRYGNFRELEI